MWISATPPLIISLYLTCMFLPLIQKSQITNDMESARSEEKTKLNELKATLYEQQRKMQAIQRELEEISAQNSELEQDFANEIGRKNQNSKEVGQIINSINNIFDICKNQLAKRGRKLEKQDVKINEESKDLVGQLIPRLQTAHQTVDELVRVYDHYGRDYDREKAYTEEIDVAMKNQNEKQPKAAAAPVRSKAGGGNDPGQGSTLGAKDSTGLKDKRS